MGQPVIRISYNRLLDPFFRSFFELQHAGTPKNSTYTSPEVVLKKVSEFINAWKKRESVLEFMQETLSLEFYQNAIDVHVVGFIKHAISSPMIISSTKSVDAFVDSLTHELLHRLVSDNTKKIPAGKILLNLYPKESRLCRNHIVVHAVLKKIYLEFFKEAERLTAIQVRDKKASAYMRAWELVDTLGADSIIAQFKKGYQK
ncbi:MAG: hypothetical protein U0517_02425 [Candidatus Andersenbacteria bacterium]